MKMKQIEKKKRSHSKKKGYWDHLSYMCKSNSGRSLPGVEHKPKRVEEAHSGTRKLHRDLDLDETIHQ